MTIGRPLTEILAYAERLADVDRDRTEEIPVTVEEAVIVQEHVAREKGFRNTWSAFDLELGGRRLRIL